MSVRRGRKNALRHAGAPLEFTATTGRGRSPPQVGPGALGRIPPRFAAPAQAQTAGTCAPEADDEGVATRVHPRP